MKSKVCVDVSLALKLVFAEEDSIEAQHLWETWAEEDTETVAPILFAFEGTSVILNRMYRGLVPPEEAELMFGAFHLLGVQLLYPEGLHKRAWELAKKFNRPQTYEMHYIALAEILDVEFWTADERLYNAIKHGDTKVKWLGNHELGGIYN